MDLMAKKDVPQHVDDLEGASAIDDELSVAERARAKRTNGRPFSDKWSETRQIVGWFRTERRMTITLKSLDRRTKRIMVAFSLIGFSEM